MSANGTARVGMVGAGAVARRHLDTLSSFPDVRVSAVADVDPARAEQLAALSGARPYPSFHAMLEREELDALYICVPPFAHGPPELAAIELGLPMFVEKPVAIDMAAAQAIADGVRERAIVTAVGYHWRYLDVAERARELLRDHHLRLAVGYWLDKTPTAGWWDRRECSGGQMVEQATHVLDLLRFVAGELTVLHARGVQGQRPAFPSSDIADAVVATLALENGAIAAVVSTCVLGAKHRTALDLFCEGMAIELSEEELVLSDGRRRDSQPARTDAKTLVDRDFIDAAKGGENRIRAPYEEALRTHQVACAIADSTEQPAPAKRPAPRRARIRGPTVRSLGVERPGVAAFFDLPSEPPRDGEVRVETIYSGLSAGTELTFFKGTNPMLHAGWDAELGLFDPGRPAGAYPVETMGYMEVAQAPEELVAAAYGHKSAQILDAARDRFVVLPDDLDPLLGVYVAHMGPICANGLLYAAAELAGPEVESLADGVRGLDVVVVGAGVVGLLTALFAAHHGAATVTVADAGERRLRAASALGLDAVDRGTRDLGRVVKERHRHGPRDHGADVAFQCRARPESLADALRSVRPHGAVIDLAFYTGGAEPLRLGEEFHHNGLTLRSAQIGRVPRGLAPAWNRDRLSAETIDLLRAHGDAIRRDLITDVVPLSAAPQLLEDLAARRREVIQAVFEMSA